MAAPSITYTFTNGTVIDASQVNTNFNNIISALTDSTKDLDVADIGATTGTIATLNTTTLTIGGITTLSSGSATAPSLAFTSTSSNTGVYLKATDSMGFVANGTEIGSYSSSGAWSYGPSAGNSVAHTMFGRSLTLSHAAATSAFLQIINTSTSSAVLDLAVQGAGDPFIYFNGAGVSTAWSLGVDNSDSDAFALSTGATLGSANLFKVSAAGLFTMGATSATHIWTGVTFTHRDTYSGGSVNLYCGNLSNTASSSAQLTLDVAGSSGGDAFIYFAIQGATNWTLGCQNAGSDQICLSPSTILGINPYWTVSTAGAWVIGPSAGGITHRINTNTQSTVGAAGAASALPANPTGYILINVNGTDRVIPYYAAS